MPRLPLALFAAALGALVLAGCTQDDLPLIQVGSQRLSVADFRRAGQGALAQYQGPPQLAKAMLLQDLQRRAVMLEYAHRMGYENTQVAMNTQRDNEQRALVQTLRARLANAAQRVSEAEARALYEARRTQAEVRLLYTSSDEGARGAVTRLRAGEPFAQVARSYSLPGVLPPDGNMGLISPGALPEPLDSALRAQKVGEIGGPYHSREGWFVMVVTNRVPQVLGPYETQRAAMYDLMRQRKERAAFNRAYLDLKAEYDVQPVTGGAQLLFRVGSAVDPLTPTPDQRRSPLATYRGGVYTLQDALLDLQRADAQRPAFQLLPAIEIWIEAQAMTRVFVIEARHRHLDEEPELVASLKKQLDDMLLEGVYQSVVATVPPPPADQVQAVWQRVKTRFTKLTLAKVAILETPDSSIAGQVWRLRATTPALVDAANQVAPRLKVTVKTVDYPNKDAQWEVFQAMFTQQQVGFWFGPEQRGNGWRILELVDKTMKEQVFEELPQGIQQNIASSAGDLAREARFNQFTDSLATAFHPVVDRELASRIPWPPLPALDLGR